MDSGRQAWRSSWPCRESSECLLFRSPRLALPLSQRRPFFSPPSRRRRSRHKPPRKGRVIVTGEGDVAVAPDHAQITSGVTTRAKSVREATDTNSKVMAAVTAALLEAGVEQKDIQTSRFSIQPVYAPQGPKIGRASCRERVENAVGGGG